MIVKSKIKKKFGFSLIEVLIAISVLGIITSGAVSLMGTGSTLLLRQGSSNVKLNTERFTLDGIYNELRKGSVASLDVLNTNDPTLNAANPHDKYIFLKDDGDSYRAFLREWDASGTVAIDRPIVGADGIKTLQFKIPTDTTATDPANYMLSISVVAERVNNTDNAVTERTAHRDVGFFARTEKSGVMVGTNYVGDAIRFAFFVPKMLAGPVIDPAATEPFCVVPGAGTGDKSGKDWDNASAGLQAGIDAVAGGKENPNSKKAYTEIWVKTGEYAVDALKLKKGVKLYGGFDGKETTAASRDARDITANKTTLNGMVGKLSVIECVVANGTPMDQRPNSADTRLDGFVISGKTRKTGVAGHGAGMYNKNTSPMIINCDFIDNVTNNDGGGMYNDKASPAVINCTFTNGLAKGDWGGGMCNVNDSSPLVDSCDFSGNSANRGGGMFNQDSSPTITNCTFSNNSAVNGNKTGGGIENNQFSAPTITGCRFIGNEAYSDGGGIYNNVAKEGKVLPPIKITDCVFVRNIASAGTSTGGDGGGICSASGSTVVEVTNSVFSGNEAQDGGGISNKGGAETTVDSCTFSGNISRPGTGGGGGIFNGGASDLTVKNSTFSGNEVIPSGAGHGGGGIYNNGRFPTITNCTFADNIVRQGTAGASVSTGGGGFLQSNSDTTITNTIFWSNTAAKDGNEIYRNGGTVALVNGIVRTGAGGIYNNQGSHVTGTPITGNPSIVSVDRRARDSTKTTLTPANVYIYTIPGNGSAYNTGTSTGAPATDQRGVLRAGNVDIGAYEYSTISWDHYPKSKDTYPILP